MGKIEINCLYYKSNTYMSSIKNCDYNASKRICMPAPSIMSLPYHIQYMIISNMNMVDAQVLCKKCYNLNIKSIINNIKWDEVNYTEAEKTDMLIKAFKSIDINIIQLLFKTVKYTSIDKINIDEKTFKNIIQICYNNNFTEGIDFLAVFKDNHYAAYKDYTDNENNQYELISQYIVNNPIEPRKIFLQLVIKNNNLNLFNYIENKYSYGIVLNFNDYKNQLFNNNNNNNIIINKIKKYLIRPSNSYLLNMYYENEIQAQTVRRQIIF